MMTRSLRVNSIRRFAITALLLVMVISSAQAAAMKIRPKAYRLIVDVQETMNPEVKVSENETKQETPEVDLVAVQGLLDRLNQLNLNKYEQALTHQFSASLALMTEDYPKAYEFFLKTWLLKSLSPDQQIRLQQTLGQLALNTEQWKEGTDHLSAWMIEVKAFNQTVEKPEQQLPIKAQDYVMLANGYVQQALWGKTVSNIQQGIQMFEQAESKVAPEDWYRISLTAYLHQEDNTSAIKVLKRLADHYPDMLYWEQLASLYQQTDNYKLALTSLHSSYIDSLMTKERHLTWLAQLLIHQESYHQAALLLEQSIQAKQVEPSVKNLKILTNAWLMARQYPDAKRALIQLIALSPDDKDSKEKLEDVERVLLTKI